MSLDTYSTDIQVHDSLKRKVLVGLVALLVLLLLNVSIFLPAGLEGKAVGRVIVPLILVSVIPILLNYTYSLSYRFEIIIDSKNQIGRFIARFFAKYYTPALIFHSVVFTIVLGLASTHVLLVLVVEQATPAYRMFALIMLFISGLLWIIEYVFWTENWPLQPNTRKMILLNWLYWSIGFGTFLGILFHAKAWNVFWMMVIVLAYCTLVLVIVQDTRRMLMKRRNDA
ncbi:MAG: hypothetical protein ACFFD4_06655 [Candidatus Odinarchaeota archaeon]